MTVAERLTIVTCENYYKEVQNALELEDLKDVDIALMPSDCTHCLRCNNEKLSEYIKFNFVSTDDVRVIGCKHLHEKNNVKSDAGQFQVCQCLLIGSSLIEQFASKGYYILSPGWLKNWKKYVLDSWGFDEETGKAFFKESAKKLLLLNSGVYDGVTADLKEISSFCGLDYEVLNTGLDYFRSRLLNTHSFWENYRKEQAAMSAARKTSDFAMVYELIPQIASLRDVNQLIQSTFEILVMFTAASRLAYISIEGNTYKDIIFFQQKEYETELSKLNGRFINEDLFITKSETGYILKIFLDDKAFGYLEVEGILFKEHMESYIHLSEFIGQILALAISNALNYKQLDDAKHAAEAASISKSQFLANMSHEIRTPMNGILGYLQLLESTLLNIEQKDFIYNIKMSTEILLNVINDILDISKIESGKLEVEQISFDIRSTIEAAVIPFAAKAGEKGLELNMLIIPEVPQRAMGDPTRLRQIISNLISNAIKFTNKGDVFVETRLKEKTDETIELLITVRDTGIGMSKETINKLFTPFTQADTSSTRKYGGTGLGLSICKSIVKMMNGDIYVESQEGKGSEFHFTVILQKNIGVEISDISDYAILKGRRIMVVDDNTMNRDIARIYLQEVGIMVDEAQSATEALSKLIRSDGSKCIYDALLVDCFMPGMNGHDLSLALKAIPVTKDIPLLLVTSIVGNEEAKKAKKSGFAGYLSKPYKRKELLDCVALVLNGKAQKIKNKEIFVTKHKVREAEFNKRPKLLLAEDNELNRNFFIRLLQSKGLNCDVVENGEKALKACMDNNYDIVFMDCQMPIMSGYEATKKIREFEGEKKHTVIIAVTAYAFKEDADKCKEAGMDDYMSKPVSIEAVMKIITKYRNLVLS